MSRIGWLSSLLIALVVIGCSRHKDGHEIVLYTSIDEPIARPIIDDFQKQTGIAVTLVADTEATKSNSLANKLQAERDHPRADVFWANEIFNSINLANQGVTAPYDSPAAAGIPARYRDPDHRWTGQALRVRVIVLSDAPGSRAHPVVRGLEDLADPVWKDQIAMALPTAGTTGGQMAALQVVWGKEKAEAWWRALHANGIHLLGGNSDVADQVGAGGLKLGLTDNDDAYNARAEGGKLQMILPDQDSIGTLMLPSTVSLIAGAPHPDDAKKLIDFLLSPAVEKRLIDAHFAYAGVRNPPSNVKAMDVDYRQVAAIAREASRRATMILQGRELEIPAPATNPASAIQPVAAASSSLSFLHVADLNYVCRLTPSIYSGSAPTTAAEFQALRDLGIKTIITVDGSKPNAELAQTYGLRYVHLPVGYDGISRQRQLEIGRAVSDLPGPFYIHCHHGQHRGPTGAVVAAMTVGGWTPQQSLGFLHFVGTSPHYAGLYETAADFKKPTEDELDHADCTFPSIARTPRLVDMMVEIDQHFDNLKALRKNNWTPLSDHPDIDASQEALLLKELFREAHRPGGPAATRPAHLIDRLTNAERAAEVLETALRARDSEVVSQAATKVENACTACHADYRDRGR